MSRASRLLLLGLAACEPATPRERGAAPAAPVPVAALVVGERSRPEVYRAAGTVRAGRRAELSTRVMGRVDSVHVRAGDRVRAGQLLLTVERGALTAAEAQAASALELARTQLQRTERLYADSAAPLVQLETARQAYAQAEAQAHAVAADLAYTSMLAPFDGIVANRAADPGDLAVPGRPLLVIEDRTAREIVVTAPETWADRLRPGQAIAVTVGTDARPVPSRVLAVVPGADPRSPTVEVRLAASAPVAPGLAAVAELPAEERRAVVVPRTALVTRGQLQGLYLFAPDSTLRLRWVRAGRAVGDSVEIASGLFPGDTVALDGAGARDGLRARPRLAAAGE